MLGLLCFVLFVASGAFRGSANAGMINQLVDEMIYELTVNMTDGAIGLPTVNTTYKTSLEGVDVSGYVILSGGSLGDLRTLTRVGDASMVNVDDTTSYLSVNLTMKTAHLADETYSMSLWSLEMGGLVDASVGSNEVAIRFTLTYDPEGNCKSNLDYVILNRLSDFSVHLGPPGFFNTIKSQIITSSLNLMANRIRTTINDEFSKAIISYASSLDVCKYLF